MGLEWCAVAMPLLHYQVYLQLLLAQLNGPSGRAGRGHGSIDETLLATREPNLFFMAQAPRLLLETL